MLNLIDRWVVAVRQAKAEADAIVAEGRQIMHWPKPLSWREGWMRWQGRSRPRHLKLKQSQTS